MVTGCDPALVGVPEIVPEDEMLNPAGSGVELHLYGCTPPVAPTVIEYANPTIAPVKDVVVMLGPMTTVILMGTDALAEFISVAVTDSEYLPGVGGVPLITPDGETLIQMGVPEAVQR